MKPVIIIPARLAATRLPDKPLADIHGKPMIVHVWERATETGIPAYVACDDKRIEAAVTGAHGKAIMTRADHPSGSDRIYEALLKIDPQGKYDAVINVQGDVPTIEPRILHELLKVLESNKADIATLAAEIRNPTERTDPSVVKAILCEFIGHQAKARDFTRSTTHADDGKFYHHIGVYGYTRRALERFIKLPPSAREKQEKLEQLRALDAGMHIYCAIVDTVPLGVDTPEHLEMARRIMRKDP